MKLYFPTKAEAQAAQDEIHAGMIASNPEYAKSVQEGQTKQWGIPMQDVDAKGRPIGTEWYIAVKNRCIDELTPEDVAGIDKRDDGKTPGQIRAAQEFTGK